MSAPVTHENLAASVTIPLAPYIGAHIAALLFVLAAWRWSRAARIIAAAGFIAAGVFNASTAFRSPSLYVSGFGPHAAPIYQSFIYGAFARHTTFFVAAIALGQAASGSLMLSHGIWRKLGYTGAIAFLVAITPLGVGSAAPSTMIFAMGIALLFRLDDVDQQPRQTSAQARE